MAKSSNTDVSKLSIEELEGLVKDAQAEITARREAERERILGQMRELAASLGMTLEDIGRPAWITEALASGKSLKDLAV